MSQTAQDVEYYDDGLVHSHGWSSATPPGGHHTDRMQAKSEREEKPRRDAA